MSRPIAVTSPTPVLTSAPFRQDGRWLRYVTLSGGSPALEMLTAAEREVALLVDNGLDHRAIAKRRRTSVNTIGNQLAAVFKKLGVASRYELTECLARLAVEETLIRKRPVH